MTARRSKPAPDGMRLATLHARTGGFNVGGSYSAVLKSSNGWVLDARPANAGVIATKAGAAALWIPFEAIGAGEIADAGSSL